MNKIPVTILGGSDHRPGPLPDSEKHQHSIGTCKGADVMIGGKRIVEWLVEELLKSDGFGPLTIAGPKEVYEPIGLPNVSIVDTDGSVGQNLRTAIDHHNHLHGEDTPMALLTYDIVVSAAEFDELRDLYESTPGAAFWMPFVRKPDDPQKLGPFQWKPSYEIRLAASDDPITILPGHLAIFTPAAMEWDMLLRLMDLAYQTRNHSVANRKHVMLKSIGKDLARHDWNRLKKGGVPGTTLTILTNGLRLAKLLKVGRLELGELERIMGRMFLRPELRKQYRVCHPIVDYLGLAEDVDTEEEAAGYTLSYMADSDK